MHVSLQNILFKLPMHIEIYCRVQVVEIIVLLVDVYVKEVFKVRYLQYSIQIIVVYVSYFHNLDAALVSGLGDACLF